MELSLRYYPDPVLRRRAPEGEGEPDEGILRIIAQMKEICRGHGGIGLAAQQVGLVLPVVVAGVPQDDDYRLVGVYNPKIVEVGGITAIREEGCLSFPGLYIPVERPRRIIAYGWFDDVERYEERELWDMAARVFCHETDHTRGVLFIDRVGEDVRRRIARELRRIAERFGKSETQT